MGKSLALGILITLVAEGIAGALVVWSGIVDVAATEAGGLAGGLPDRLLAYAAVRSIRHHAGSQQNPLARDPAALKVGLQHYREMCLQCHGGPGMEPGEFAAGLHPPAPDLTSPDVQSFSDAMLYQTIARGIGSTGMPAFERTHHPKEIWSIVAFVRHLSQLSPEERQQLGQAEESPATQPGPPAERPEAATPAVVAGEGGVHVHRISINNFKFEPHALEVPSGDVIVWTNGDLVPHTATADDRSFDTGKIEGGASKRVVVKKKGTFPYSCRYHPSMTGTLTVDDH